MVVNLSWKAVAGAISGGFFVKRADELSSLHKRQLDDDVRGRPRRPGDRRCAEGARRRVQVSSAGDARLEKARRRSGVGNAQPWNVFRGTRLVQGPRRSVPR